MKKNLYKFLFLVIFLISCNSEDKQTNEPEVYDFSDRNYTVFDDYARQDLSAVPLLIVLHGAGSSANSMIQATRFNSIAGANGYLIVYPDAFQGLWNFGDGCGMAFPERPDDVEFIKYILQELSQKYNIDEKRIYITGFSMGGYFTYYLAKKLPGKFAAIAPVAATMPRYLSQDNTMAPISVLIELGTKDASVNYEGSGEGDCDELSGEESVKYWALLNGCNAEPEISYLPDNGIDYLNVRIDNYKNCNLPYETKLISVEGGSHRWYINEEINISQIIVDFFSTKFLQ